MQTHHFRRSHVTTDAFISYYLNKDCYLFQVTHKFPYSVLGSMGGVSWKLRNGVFASKLFVRWSIPFILDSASSKRMDVGFTEVDEPNWYASTDYAYLQTRL